MDTAARGTLGDGQISIADLVQAGRYAAGLDPLTIAGGPTNLGGGGMLRPADSITRTRVLMSRSPALQAGTRTLSVVSWPGRAGWNAPVIIQLNAAGGENAASFSLVFDPAVLSPSSVLGVVDAQANTLTASYSAGAIAIQSGSTWTSRAPARTV